MKYNNIGIFAAKNKIQNFDKSIKPLLDEIFANIAKSSDLNAFTAVYKDEAYARAAELEKKMASGAPKGKLFGIPVSIKDNIAFEGKTLTCASNMLKGCVASKNATVTNLLLKEDAIIVGKTNMDEFAMGGANTYSAYGRVKNPFASECVPGGSSGGSACSVSSAQCCASLGTDTGGSVRQPAAFCGIVGSKPTYGTICGDGVMPMAPSFDQVGALTNNVEDNALINSIISTAGYGAEAAQVIYDVKQKDDKSAAMSFLRGKKIAVSREFEQDIKNSESGDSFERAILMLQKAGAIIVPFSLPELLSVLEIYKIMMSAEAATCFSILDGKSFGNTTDADTAVESVVKSRSLGFGSEVKKRVFKGTFFLEHKEYYNAAAKTLDVLCKKLNSLYQNVDVVLWPTAIIGAFNAGEEARSNSAIDLSDKLTIVANLTGRPSVSVPCGHTKHGLPLGLHFMGKHHEDDNLFILAGICEYLLGYSFC